VLPSIGAPVGEISPFHRGLPLAADDIVITRPQAASVENSNDVLGLDISESSAPPLTRPRSIKRQVGFGWLEIRESGIQYTRFLIL
jgi:hypothetical protein